MTLLNLNVSWRPHVQIHSHWGLQLQPRNLGRGCHSVHSRVSFLFWFWKSVSSHSLLCSSPHPVTLT